MSPAFFSTPEGGQAALTGSNIDGISHNRYNNSAMKILKLSVIAVLVINFVLPCSFALEPVRDLDGYRIGPENVLQIDVYYGRDKELSRRVRVSSRGRITFPLLGEVEAQGFTVAELEEKLTYLLDKDYLVNPQVSVFIEQYSTVSILGQVNDPGAYEIRGSLSLIELISHAGGFTRIAATNDVRILRTDSDGNRSTIRVRAHDIINRGREDEDVRLQPGDIVTVPESFF